MIKSIELKNIQSHENTRLELDKGINCIVGSSNNGKSAILRGLYWIRYNRPLGIDTLASHWALNKKGELNDEMSVTIENENGVVYRKRAKNENQYIINDEILNVVKSDVPTKVEQVLKLSDTNIQKQLDEPFLLSETSGEVAKYFNKIVRLDVIDRVSTNAETTRRKTKSDIENVEKLIKEQEQKKERYDWLDLVEKLLKKWENVKVVNDGLNSKFEELENQINTFSENVNITSKYQSIIIQKEKVEIILELYEKVQKTTNIISSLSNSLLTYKELSEKIEKLNKVIQLKKLIEDVMKADGASAGLRMKIAELTFNLDKFKVVKIYPNFSEQKKIIKKLIDWKDDGLDRKINSLIKSIFDYDNAKKYIENSKLQIKYYQKQLPDICPLCGNPMKNGVCER